MSEANKALVRRFVDQVINGHNLNVMDEFASSDIVDHAAEPGAAPGLKGMKQFLGPWFAAFPDVNSAINQIVAEGDMVVVYVTTTGTNTGEFMGIRPTGKSITMAEMHMVRIANGKFVEHWGVVDAAALMQQLGVPG